MLRVSRSKAALRWQATARPSPRALALALLVGAVLALASAAFSLAMVSEASNPFLAVRIAPWLPRAQARIGDLVFATSKGTPDRQQEARIRRGAARALQSTSLNSAALRQLAMTDRDMTRRKRLLDLAIVVSRRDPIANIQRSEFDIRRNDTEATLTGLDRALRVSPEVAPAVFPVLLEAADNPALLPKIRGMLAPGPIWSERMVAWAGENPAALGKLSRVLSALPKGSVALAPGYGQSIISQLSEQRQPAEAFAAYAAYSRPARFDDLDRAMFAPIDWQLNDDYETGARPVADGSPGFDMFAERGKAGPAAARLLALDPGGYRLTLRQTEADGRGGELRLALTCLAGQREWPLAGRKLAIADGTAVTTFLVPVGCRHQRFRLGIAAGDEPVRVVLRAARLNRQGVVPGKPG